MEKEEQSELVIMKSGVSGSYYAEDQGFFASREDATPVTPAKAERFAFNFYRLNITTEPAVI